MTIALVMLVTGVAALALASRPLIMPAAGLDPSWRYAAEYASLEGLIFGRDFNFTVGPLAVVYTRLFHPDTLHWIVIATIHAIAVYAAVVWYSAGRWRGAMVLAVLALLYAPLNADAFFLSLPLAVFFLALQGSVPFPVIAGLIVGLAIPSLAKFSMFVLTLPLLVLLDASAWIRRERCPWYLATYAASITVVYMLSGQPVAALWSFLYGSVDIGVGYGQAMSNFWWSWHQTFLMAASVGILATAWTLIRADKSGIQRGGYALGLVWFIYIAFKLGNVRIGHHDATWQALAAAGALFLLLPASRAGATRVATALAVAWIVAPLLFAQTLNGVTDLQSIVRARAAELAGQLTAVGGWITPAAKLERLTGQRRAIEAQLGARVPENLTGTVGSVPWEFSDLIAAGVSFSPAPPLQMYSNYTPRLRALTRQYFESDERPEHLFFRLDSIDGRFPTMELGPALSSIIAGYDVVRVRTGLRGSPLQLRRRTTPRVVHARPIGETHAVVGRWAEIPPVDRGALILAIHPRERLGGRVLTALYKQASFRLDLQFANGVEVAARFLPSLVADGFVVVPPGMTEAQLFLEAAQGFDIDRANPLRRIRVRARDLGKFRYEPGYIVTATAVTITGAPEHAPLLDMPARTAMDALIEGRVIESPEVRVVGGDLLAHAPSAIAVVLPPGRRLRGEFGFFDGAWQTGDPRPVTFSISALAPDGPRVLFERQLHPKAHAADRGRQSFSIELPRGAESGGIELVFATRPGTQWGWTYWSNLDVLP